MQDMQRVKYLESLLPYDESELNKKYKYNFERYATYLGNGVYQWGGIACSDIRELWLMGVLSREGIEFKQV